MESTGWMDGRNCCHGDPPLHVLYISLLKEIQYKTKKKESFRCNTCANPLLFRVCVSVGLGQQHHDQEEYVAQTNCKRTNAIYATVMRQSRNCDTRERDDGLERKACRTIHTVVVE